LAGNIVMWDRFVMLASLMARHEIDFSWILIAEIQERAFREKTTLPFHCLIFHLCIEASVLVWGCDRFIKVTKMVDVALIRDYANPATLRRGIPFYLPPMGVALATD